MLPMKGIAARNPMVAFDAPKARAKATRKAPPDRVTMAFEKIPSKIIDFKPLLVSSGVKRPFVELSDCRDNNLSLRNFIFYEIISYLGNILLCFLASHIELESHLSVLTL